MTIILRGFSYEKSLSCSMRIIFRRFLAMILNYLRLRTLILSHFLLFYVFFSLDAVILKKHLIESEFKTLDNCILLIRMIISNTFAPVEQVSFVCVSIVVFLICFT